MYLFIALFALFPKMSWENNKEKMLQAISRCGISKAVLKGVVRNKNLFSDFYKGRAWRNENGKR